jgi:hypothetical protein
MTVLVRRLRGAHATKARAVEETLVSSRITSHL